MTMEDGERQVAPTLDGIRRDHRARYEFAARTLPAGSRVIDFACGVGYGARILADAGHKVQAVDISEEALAYGERHYAHPLITFRRLDANAAAELGAFDAAVCFETIEHISDPQRLLRALRDSAPLLLASVPNEEVFPWRGHEYHVRHYTRAQFSDLLQRSGWSPTEWLGQEGPESAVAPAVNGRTLVAMAVRSQIMVGEGPAPATGKHVAILGLGPSVNQFLEITKRLGGRSAFCDEVWGINALGDVFICDLLFHMDDVRVQEARAAAKPGSNIARMVSWLRNYRGRVITSRAHPGYPALEEFPLEAVLNDVPTAYFNSTAAYAIAYAVHRQVRKVTVFGNDFTYPDVHDAEKGRACVEFWLGIATSRGIEISLPKTTSLMDAMYPPAQRFYGYDCVELDIQRVDGRITVGFEERGVPDVEEVEKRYDHSRHPNPYVEEAPA